MIGQNQQLVANSVLSEFSVSDYTALPDCPDGDSSYGNPYQNFLFLPQLESIIPLNLGAA